MLAVAALAAVAALPRWESHGEVTDAAVLARPVLSDELISAVNSDPTSTWVAGRSPRFENMTIGEAKTLMGTLQSTDQSSWLPYRPLQAVSIPEEFDWRTDARAKSCPSVKEVRDQANCGSCWAFGSVEAMTDRICIASNGTKHVHLSAQDMTSCNTDGNHGCSGGVPSTCYDYYMSTGVVSGGNYGDKSGCWSYQLHPCEHHTTGPKYPACADSTKAPSCARKCTDNAQLSWKSDKHHGKAGYSVCKQGAGSCAEAMAQEIYQNGPITAQFFVHQSFESYKSGVYQKKSLTDPMLGGHAIKIIGYGNENGVPYWLVANSWNEDWGMGGFFKIKRGSNECQIENAVLNGGPVAGEPRI
eukprot:TRINITY_DN3130_c0_g1_i1.p2 TRINITY_DN3130_c0_g1~~TRINITY_DN3130_c0_g1_i1.p2  ORF type:complete len:383 (+),score=128.51 TRINITY_DN3130_c0_g1_i1:76-1149(+)